jgi:YHS domain-containing protein
MMRVGSIAIACFFAGACATAIAQEDHANGYWKFHVPELNKPFGNDDVVALAQGKHVATDCSVPWIGGDGNTYCFSNIASREEFLHAPMDYYRQAQRVIERERGGNPRTSQITLPLNKTKATPAFETQEKSWC